MISEDARQEMISLGHRAQALIKESIVALRAGELLKAAEKAEQARDATQELAVRIDDAVCEEIVEEVWRG